MKKRIAALLLAGLALIAPKASHASVIFQDLFTYAGGDLSTVSSGVWSNFSGSKDLFVTNVPFAQLQVGSTGGTLSRSGDECRFFVTGGGTPLPQQVLYASFTVTCTNLPNGAGTYFAAFFKDGTPGGFSGRINSFTNTVGTPNTWRVGATGNVATTNAAATGPQGQGLPIDLALNTTYQVVARLDPTPTGLQACSVWINPISESDTSFSSSDSLGYSLNASTPVDGFAFRQASPVTGVNNWFGIVTNVVLATSFNEALTNVMSTNAVNPTLVVAPVGVTNFTGNSTTIFGVVNGQGQAGIVYTWKKGSGTFSNPNGNSPVLTFSSPATTDSGSYQLIATTPYGLSVTSSPVNVLFTDQPVAPKITSGPSSTSAFVGQTVTMTVNFTSPGNVSFTWRSNNVILPDQTSQTLTLVDVQTNYSANYTVALTNDVLPTSGVVSSNAVLTVSPAQSVNIGFLRTLVDPATFAPTNIPPSIPYTVTGVITTFTNTTSGNTSSYFLQDSTGGINIFATFGNSTDIQGFRPVRGDTVTFTGVLSSFNGLELDANTNTLPQTSYEIDNTNGVVPAPVFEPLNFTNTLSATVLNEQVAGLLITITNVSFGTNGGVVLSTTANQTFQVTNGLGQSFGVSFFDLDLDTAGQTLPTGNIFSITGVVEGGPNPPSAATPFTLAVTKFSDIEVTSPVITPVPITVSSISGGKIVLTWSNPALILESSTNVNGPYSPVAGATSPFTNTIAPTGNLFFQLSH